MEPRVLTRVALVSIPLGLFLLVVGEIGAISQGAGWPFWTGTVFFALGVLAAVAAVWNKRSSQ
jgi:membrane protein implicated in regulation of membrane protease activity